MWDVFSHYFFKKYALLSANTCLFEVSFILKSLEKDKKKINNILTIVCWQEKLRYIVKFGSDMMIS